LTLTTMALVPFAPSDAAQRDCPGAAFVLHCSHLYFTTLDFIVAAHSTETSSAATTIVRQTLQEFAA